MKKFIDINSLTLFYNKLTTVFAKVIHKHKASDVIQDSNNMMVTEQEKNNWNNKADIEGNYSNMTVGSANKLSSVVKINGVGFDGSKDITIQDSTKLSLNGGVISGDLKVNNLTVESELIAWNSLAQHSDLSLKRNINKISDALNKVRQINGYTFDMVTDDKRHAGVIAQEIEKVLPEVIVEDEYGLLGVAYGNIVALLIESIKELDEQNRKLKKEIEHINTKLKNSED